MATRIYDSKEVVVSIAGIPMEGYADGEFLTISFESDAFADVVGTDGEVTRSKTNDRRATVTVKLMQGSPANTLLSALYAADQLAGNGAGIGAFLVSDPSGSGATLYAAAECWIQKHPDISFDRTATSREWVIRVAELVAFTAG